MAMRMKGIYKGGFKFISQMFGVAKERDMEIGFPTDVKHVAHIGWDGAAGNAPPSWMNEFKTAPATSLGNIVEPTWSEQDFEQSMGGLDIPHMDVSKKSKHKKSSTPKSSSSFRSSRKTNFMAMEVKMEIEA